MDALTDTIDRMQPIDGRKAILLISSGVDTSASRPSTRPAAIFRRAACPFTPSGSCNRFGTSPPRPAACAAPRSWTSCKPTARCARSPPKARHGLLPALHHRVSGDLPRHGHQLRSRYLIAYTPSNQARDGSTAKSRWIWSTLQQSALTMKDDKNKPLKYTVYAKSGYTAPKRWIDARSQSQELNLTAFEFLTKCLTSMLQTC